MITRLHGPDANQRYEAGFGRVDERRPRGRSRQDGRPGPGFFSWLFFWPILVFFHYPRWAWGGVAGLFVLGLAGAGAATVYVVRVTADLPTIDELVYYDPPQMTRVHAGDGRVIAEYARESRVYVPIETIPPHIIAAFISAEDKNFYDHNGLDPVGMVRAGLRNIYNRARYGPTRLQGASTITQQVAKNFLLSSEQRLERKIREMALALRIEEVYSKDYILELYLNEIYLGRRAYGVAAASLLYFGKSLDELTLSEIAYLAGLPKGPNNYHPTRNRAAAIGRRNYVLGRMVDNGYVAQADADEAMRDDLVVVERLEGSTYTAAEYFVEEVRRRVFSMYGEDELYDGGLSVRTTLDTQLQVSALRALRHGLGEYDRRHGFRGPIDVIDPGSGWEERLAEVETLGDVGEWRPAVVLRTTDAAATIGFLDGSEGSISLEELAWAREAGDDIEELGPEITAAGQALRAGEVIYVEALEGELPDAYALRQVPGANGAIMAMDPHTGRVLALVGGYSYRLSQFNRATQARRQPGSAFKPFVYAAALESGLTPASLVLDAPYVSQTDIDGAFYRPTNYTAGRWYGESTLRLGVEQSRNAMTVRLANDIGLERVSAIGERFGIYDELPAYESMSLGAGETTLWRMVTAYAQLVNGGMQVEPTLLDRVQDRTGETIFYHDVRDCSACIVEDWSDIEEPELPDEREEVIDRVTAYQMVSILEGVVERGTGRRLRSLGFPVAGKTGTTNDFRDAWFIGFTPDLVVGVYVGNDNPLPLGYGEAGGRVSAPVFQEFMAAAHEGQTAIPFRIPPGVSLVRVDSRTGVLARAGDPNSIYEAFRPGTQPTRYASRDSEISGGLSFDGGAPLGDPFVEDEVLPAIDGFADPGALDLRGDGSTADTTVPSNLPEFPRDEEPEEDDLGGLY